MVGTFLSFWNNKRSLRKDSEQFVSSRSFYIFQNTQFKYITVFPLGAGARRRRRLKSQVWRGNVIQTIISMVYFSLGLFHFCLPPGVAPLPLILILYGPPLPPTGHPRGQKVE